MKKEIKIPFCVKNNRYHSKWGLVIDTLNQMSSSSGFSTRLKGNSANDYYGIHSTGIIQCFPRTEYFGEGTIEYNIGEFLDLIDTPLKITNYEIF
jgi:hypothetical protein